MSDTMKRVIRIASIVIAAGLLIFSGIRIWNLYESYEQSLADAKEAKASLESDLSRQRQELAEADAEIDEMNAGIHSVRTIGSDIAKVQNSWDSETSPEELATYFQDDECYQWYSDKKSNESWTCMNDYDFEGDSTLVIWLCTGSSLTEDISAYATAEYSAETGKMSNLKVGLVEKDEEEDTEETETVENESDSDETSSGTSILEGADNDEEEYTTTVLSEDNEETTETSEESEEDESEETSVSQDEDDTGGNET